MKVRDVMTAPAITVGPDTVYTEVVHRLLANGISGVPVVDDEGRLLGMVTETDLVFKEAYGNSRSRALGLIGEILRDQRPQWAHKAEATTARDLMTTEPVCAELDEELAVVARRMLACSIKRLPVVSGGRVVGIVSRHDLLRQFDRPDRTPTS